MSTGISRESPPTVRQSVYWLSVLAAALQHGAPPDDTSHNTRVKTAWAPNSTSRSLNHIAALLTRGRNSADEGEGPRVVAVTSGPFQANSINLSVFASPTGSPTITPSSSSGVAQENCPEGTTSAPPGPLSSSDIPPVNCPDGTTAAAIAGEVESMILTRNSLFGDELGKRFSFTVPVASADTPMPLLNTILSNPPSFSPEPITFALYVEQSLSLIRAAAARLATDPSCRNTVMNAVCIYFVASCRSKLSGRITRCWESYVEEDLKNWTPTEKTIPESSIIISGSFIPDQLKILGLQPTSNSSYTFNLSTVTLWWKAVLRFLMLLTKLVQNKKPASSIAIASLHLHILLRKLPASFWALGSLDAHLLRCKKHKGVDKVPTHQKDDDEQNDDDDDDPVEDSLAGNPLMDSTTAPHSASFCRIVDALSAWTTGPQFLLSEGLARASIPIHVSVIDLPRTPIPPVDADTLLQRWIDKGNWSDRIGDKILLTVKKLTLTSLRGACHCEAGLIASLLVHSRLPSKGGDSEDQAAPGPAVLSAALDTEANLYTVWHPFLTSLVQDMTGERSIGVAKKCCPLCRILGDVLEEKYGLHITLPGQHTKFFPWVPPSWLQLDALQEMEQRLLRILEEMVEKKLSTSRTSSPASDRGVPDPNPEDTVEFNVFIEDIASL
ncbi:hypothetical protein C8J57DRAFT_1327932 [Mycena rebaudengoi]|nr:hypothetical protein C8J57DRAFT_1327932 [Mycena rebaudengoi]